MQFKIKTNCSPGFWVVAVLLLLSFIGTDSAKILFFHKIGSYSQRVQTYPLASALADKGHEVTIMSPFPLRKHLKQHPKIREIVPQSLVRKTDELLSANFAIERRVNKTLPKMYDFYPLITQLCEVLLDSEEYKDFVQQTESMDLVILANTMTECGLGMVYKFKAKLIFFHQLAPTGSDYDTFGYNPETWAIPEMNPFSPKTPMTFLEKVENTLNPIRMRYYHYQYMTNLDKLLRANMELNGMPFLDDVMRNASLILYASDVITDYPRSVPPNVIHVGGLHCKPSEGNLPQNIVDFLKKSQNSSEMNDFIYISLGSVVQPATLPDATKSVFFKTIASFSHIKFMWKWNGELPNTYPKNLYLSTWFPQMEILAHPKLRAFVTQSGRPSIYESVCNAVPMIAFPVLSDQDNNAHRMNMMGGNVVLELSRVTRTELTDAIKTVVKDTRMKERMKELQRIFYDMPMSPLDTALWWTEYVLRHDDCSHLRPAGFNQTWYERRLLDVWAFIFTGILAGLAITWFGCIFIVKRLTRMLTTKSKTD